MEKKMSKDGGNEDEAGREDSSLYWTNEKHLHYLNSMEASFVRTMFENNGRFLRLDRYLPDSFESTLDSRKDQRLSRRPLSNSGIRNRRVRSHENKIRRISSATQSRSSSSQDQVVPELEDWRTEDNKDEKGPRH